MKIYFIESKYILSNFATFGNHFYFACCRQVHSLCKFGHFKAQNQALTTESGLKKSTLCFKSNITHRLEWKIFVYLIGAVRNGVTPKQLGELPD